MRWLKITRLAGAVAVTLGGLAVEALIPATASRFWVCMAYMAVGLGVVWFCGELCAMKKRGWKLGVGKEDEIFPQRPLRQRIGILSRGKNGIYVGNEISNQDIAIQDEGENSTAKDNKVS